jgi:uncharacterized membrane protein
MTILALACLVVLAFAVGLLVAYIQISPTVSVDVAKPLVNTLRKTTFVLAGLIIGFLFALAGVFG